MAMFSKEFILIYPYLWKKVLIENVIYMHWLLNEVFKKIL